MSPANEMMPTIIDARQLNLLAGDGGDLSM
jgi:hypothetical protein